MLSVETTLTFLTAATLLALAPGPDNLFVLMQSVLYGPRAGMAIVLGLCTGLLVHTTAVVVGIAAIFQTSATAFTVLKFLGAGYLLFLAWQVFRCGAISVTDKQPAALSFGKLYRRGILMNVTNPKVTIFFLALLPQFADADRGSVAAQLTMLGGLFIVATLVVFGTLAALAGTFNRWLTQSDRLQGILNRLAATVFVGLAIKLATARR